jgi:hypothetical protein
MEIAKWKMQIGVRAVNMPAMRKWALIGLAVVAISMVAHLLSQPRKGSVEYHKRRYLEAWDRNNRLDWQGRIGDRLGRQIGIRPPFLYASRTERGLLAEEMRLHRNALVRLEYLSEKWIVFSNRSVPTMSMLTNWPPEEEYRLVDFFFTDSAHQRKVWLIAPSARIKVWEDYFRKFDVPEK